MASCPYGIAFTVTGKVTPLWCGKWSCERCRIINAKLWAWRAKLHIDNSNTTAYFWTLTLRASITSPYQGFKALPGLWDTLRKRVQRDTGKWTYLAFVECHPKRGKIPHLHVLSMVKCPEYGTHKTNPLKDFAWSCGFGYMATEEPIESGKAAGYVAKYASKHDPSIPRNFRRCRCSQDWAKLPEIELSPYIVKTRDESLTDYLLRVHWRTDVRLDTLYIRWTDALDEYMIEQR